MKKLIVLIAVTIAMSSMAIASESLAPENCAATHSSQKREVGKKLAQPAADQAPVIQKAHQINVE